MKHTFHLIAVVFLSSVLAISCGEKVKNTVDLKEKAEEIAEALPASWPVPNRHLGSIPVYETFEEIEPLFRQQNDTTYIVNFWATWCKPCIEELPYLEQLNEAETEQPLKVVLVSLDFPKHLESKLLPFVEKQQLRSQVEVLLDGDYNSWIDKVSTEWSGAIPATYIYKRDASLFIGEPFESYDDLTQSVKTIL